MRATDYTEERAGEICEWIARGRSLVSYCKRKDTPGYRTVMRWLKEQPAFQADYRTAHQHQAEYLAEETLDLADKVRMTTIKTKRADGQVDIVTKDNVERTRIQVDVRKWYASKLAPKKYGDKLELGGVVGVAKAPTDLTDEDLQDIINGRKAKQADAADA